MSGSTDISLKEINISSGGTAMVARGASRRNGSTQILKRHGWYWLNPVRAYATKDGAEVVAQTVAALRDAGLSVTDCASHDTGDTGEGEP